jgi:regulator of sigma E protease
MEEVLGWFINASYVAILFCVLVYVHELGHYLVARWCGVRIEVFSIGFGRELFGYTDKAGTRWKFSIVPLGGYVRMFGEHSMEAVQGDTGEAMTPEEEAVSFDHKSLGWRAAIVAAGPAANFLFAIVAGAILFASVGSQEPRDFKVFGIGAVVPDSAAFDAGLAEGDRILSVDGREVPTWEGFVETVQSSGGEEMVFKVERDGIVSTMRIAARFDETAGVHRIGIHMPFQVVQHGPIESLGMAATATWTITGRIFEFIGEALTGQRSLDDMGGPVKIAEISYEAADTGLLAWVNIMIILSINLGLLNLLPIPVLDGGHLLFYAIEAVRGKPLNEQAQEYLLRGGLALLLGLMIIVTLNDLHILDFLISIAS